MKIQPSALRTGLTLLPLLVLLSACGTSRSSDRQELGTFQTRFSKVFTIDDVPADARLVSAWFPLPPSNQFQKIHGLTVDPATPVHVDPLYGNRVAHLTWKAPFDGPLAVKVSYTLERQEEISHQETISDQLLARYLEPDRLGVIDERIREMSANITRGKPDTLSRARAIYDHVLENMHYGKVLPGWGKGDTRRACEVGQGNCSDFHALFISLARAAGIPARFHYGYSLKLDGQAGPHCWAEFLDEKEGWVPVDISEADKDPSRTEYFFGRLSADRVLFTTGRDLVLDPPQHGEPLNFFIEPYVEVDGEPYGKVTVAATHQPAG